VFSSKIWTKICQKSCVIFTKKVVKIAEALGICFKPPLTPGGWGSTPESVLLLSYTVALVTSLRAWKLAIIGFIVKKKQNVTNFHFKILQFLRWRRKNSFCPHISSPLYFPIYFIVCLFEIFNVLDLKIFWIHCLFHCCLLYMRNWKNKIKICKIFLAKLLFQDRDQQNWLQM